MRMTIGSDSESTIRDGAVEFRTKALAIDVKMNKTPTPEAKDNW